MGFAQNFFKIIFTKPSSWEAKPSMVESNWEKRDCYTLSPA
jgi:hypothetical protein